MGLFSSTPRIVSKDTVIESLTRMGVYQHLIQLFALLKQGDSLEYPTFQ
jgi:hypothetical protein